MKRPVWTMALPSGFSVMDSDKLARKSIPAEAMVSQLGKACCDLLIMFIVIVFYLKIGMQEGQVVTCTYIFFCIVFDFFSPD